MTKFCLLLLSTNLFTPSSALAQAAPAQAGYCWGRADWPVVRCEDAQLRCDSSIS